MKASCKEVIDKFLRWGKKKDTREKKKDFEYIWIENNLIKNEILFNMLIVINAIFLFFEPSNYC